MTSIDVHDLPPVITLCTAAQLLGIGRTAAYELVRTNAWPTPVLRLGRLIRIPTAPLLDLLSVRPESHDNRPPDMAAERNHRLHKLFGRTTV